jgi:hypothetical protein
MAHLYQEAKIMPVREHLDLLSTQFLANALQPHHPSHGLIMAPLAPRAHLKPSLQAKYGAAIAPYLHDGTIFPSSYKKVLKALHTSAMQSAINGLADNRVLDTRPPEVNLKEEMTLQRPDRSTLRQLQSGHCKGLKEYQHFIGTATDNRCPKCSLLLHSTFHLFQCIANPIALTPWDLWKHPREATEFISTAPSFSYLPLLDPLPLPSPELPPTGVGGTT